MDQVHFEIGTPPMWEAAEKYLPDVVDDLMYMGYVVYEGTVIHQLKHYMTRRYINLDDAGQTWIIGQRVTDNDPWSDESMALPYEAAPMPLDEALSYLLD